MVTCGHVGKESATVKLNYVQPACTSECETPNAVGDEFENLKSFGLYFLFFATPGCCILKFMPANRSSFRCFTLVEYIIL